MSKMGKLALQNKAQKKDKRQLVLHEGRLGLIYVLIPLVAWMFFNVFTLIISFISMFGDIHNVDISTFQWNDFASFKYVFTDPQSGFFPALQNTLFVTSAQFVSLGISLLCAVLLSQKRRITKILEVVLFIPYICSSVAVAIMWRWMFNEDAGIINNILVSLFGEGAKVHWMTDPQAYRWMLFIITVWKDPGYGIVMYKAALKNIDGTLYEAGRLDGANNWQLFMNITLPKISSTTFFLLMAGIISGMKCFDIAMVVSPLSWNGTAGPNNAGLTMVYYTYLEGITWDNMSVASVISWVLFAIIFVLSYINMKGRKAWVNDD